MSEWGGVSFGPVRSRAGLAFCCGSGYLRLSTELRVLVRSIGPECPRLSPALLLPPQSSMPVPQRPHRRIAGFRTPREAGAGVGTAGAPFRFPGLARIAPGPVPECLRLSWEAFSTSFVLFPVAGRLRLPWVGVWGWRQASRPSFQESISPCRRFRIQAYVYLPGAEAVASSLPWQ